MLSFFCATLPVLFAVTAGFSAEECESGFNNLAFQIENVAKYGKYFGNDTAAVPPVLSCGGAGTFEGATGIETFARFETFNSPYFGNFAVVAQSSHLTGYNQGESCSILVNHIAEFRTNCANAVPTSLNRSIALLVKYSPSEDRILSIDAYYPKPLLNAYFGGILATKRTRRYVCKTREYSCPKVDAKESAMYETDENSCESSLGQLPPLSAGGYMNGNDTACRVLHAPAAEAKKKGYCAPLSIYSHTEGEVACQTAQNGTVSKGDEMLSQEELKLYETFTSENGIAPMDGYHVTCVDDIDWTSDSGYDCAAVAQAPFSRCRTTLGAEFACAHTCHSQCASKTRYSTA